MTSSFFASALARAVTLCKIRSMIIPFLIVASSSPSTGPKIPIVPKPAGRVPRTRAVAMERRTTRPFEAVDGERLIESVVDSIGTGASALFATSHLADELAVEHDPERAGERIIATELLTEENDALGSPRFWFDSRKFVQLLTEGRIRDLASVMDAMENFDVDVRACFVESGGDADSLAWNQFVEWRAVVDRAIAMRLSLLMATLRGMIRVKVHAVRFRKRVHSPGGTLHEVTMKRLRGR